MIKQFFSKLCRSSHKSANGSVLIKDYCPDNDTEDASEVVALHGIKSQEQAVARKKDPAERFTESVDKLVEKLEGINDNLSRQTQQHEDLVQKLDELPRLLVPVPAAVNQQREALQQMIEQLRCKLEQDQAVAHTLSKLPEQADRQAESLEAIEDRLSAAADVDVKLSETFTRVAESLGKLDADVAGEVDWLRKINQGFSENEKLLRETLAAQQRRFFRVFAVAVAVSLVAITGLVIALLVLLQK